MKKKNLALREFAFFFLVAAFDEFFFWLAKKGRTKNMYANWRKLISSSVKYKYYYLIVLIDRAPQHLYLQRYSYRWRNIDKMSMFMIIIFPYRDRVLEESLFVFFHFF